MVVCSKYSYDFEIIFITLRHINLTYLITIESNDNWRNKEYY